MLHTLRSVIALRQSPTAPERKAGNQGGLLPGPCDSTRAYEENRSSASRPILLPNPYGSSVPSNLGVGGRLRCKVHDNRAHSGGIETEIARGSPPSEPIRAEEAGENVPGTTLSGFVLDLREIG